MEKDSAHLCLLKAHELGMLFPFLNGWGKIKREIIFHHTWKWFEILISVSTDKVVLGHRDAQYLCLTFVYGCFCTIVADSSSCDRDHIAHKVKSICYLALGRKCLLTPGLEQEPWKWSILVLTSTLSLKYFVTLGRWRNISRSCFYLQWVNWGWCHMPLYRIVVNIYKIVHLKGLV